MTTSPETCAYCKHAPESHENGKCWSCMDDSHPEGVIEPPVSPSLVLDDARARSAASETPQDAREVERRDPDEARAATFHALVAERDALQRQVDLLTGGDLMVLNALQDAEEERDALLRDLAQAVGERNAAWARQRRMEDDFARKTVECDAAYDEQDRLEAKLDRLRAGLREFRADVVKVRSFDFTHIRTAEVLSAIDHVLATPDADAQEVGPPLYNVRTGIGPGGNRIILSAQSHPPATPDADAQTFQASLVPGDGVPRMAESTEDYAHLTDADAQDEGCHADRDGDCTWSQCPQIRDGEPVASGRHCPIDRRSDAQDEGVRR